MSRFTDINNKVNHLQLQYNLAVKYNEQFDANKAKIDALNVKYSNCDNYIQVLRNIESATKSYYSQFQEDRMKFIETHLKTNTDYLFPKKGFNPKIDYDVKRRKIKSNLELIDKDGNKRMPHITEGGMLKQLIGYTSAISILQLVGSDVFFIDEAFSNASATSKEKMQAILYHYIYEMGLQTIMITQSSDCYSDLPRKEFYLELDPSGSVAHKVGEKVFDLNYSKTELINDISSENIVDIINEIGGDSFE